MPLFHRVHFLSLAIKLIVEQVQVAYGSLLSKLSKPLAFETADCPFGVERRRPAPPPLLNRLAEPSPYPGIVVTGFKSSDISGKRSSR